jgi:D-psicose/D-tagatose/L-ribulose 3-epimerase
MPKFGAHAFLWIDEWTSEKGNLAIEAANKAGFDLIEIPILEPDKFFPEAHKDILAGANLVVAGSAVLPWDAHMPENPEGAKRFLIKVLDKLEIINGTYMVGCFAYALGKFSGAPPTHHELDVTVHTLREVAREAERRGITLCLEVLNRYEGYLYTTLQEARSIIKAVGVPNLKLHADAYHMNIEEEGYYRPLLECADVLGYMHISESHRGLVGTGTINWDDVFRGLADAHYSGPLVLESFAAVNPALAGATKIWRAPKHSSDVLASEGLKFLKHYAEKYGLSNEVK